MKTTVTRVGSAEWEQAKREGRAVYIGRACRRSPDDLVRTGSKFANPFVIGKKLLDGSVMDRTGVIRRYREYIEESPELKTAAKTELRGKVLGCWCHPKACHGDVLASLANAQEVI